MGLACTLNIFDPFEAGHPQQHVGVEFGLEVALAGKGAGWVDGHDLQELCQGVGSDAVDLFLVEAIFVDPLKSADHHLMVDLDAILGDIFGQGLAIQLLYY